jgi:hypothetical protein
LILKQWLWHRSGSPNMSIYICLIACIHKKGRQNLWTRCYNHRFNFNCFRLHLIVLGCLPFWKNWGCLPFNNFFDVFHFEESLSLLPFWKNEVVFNFEKIEILFHLKKLRSSSILEKFLSRFPFRKKLRLSSIFNLVGLK